MALWNATQGFVFGFFAPPPPVLQVSWPNLKPISVSWHLLNCNPQKSHQENASECYWGFRGFVFLRCVCKPSHALHKCLWLYANSSRSPVWTRDTGNGHRLGRTILIQRRTSLAWGLILGWVLPAFIGTIAWLLPTTFLCDIPIRNWMQKSDA